MPSERRDPLDHLLDGALASYGQPCARPGLENRVLRRVRDDGGRPGWPLRWWAAAGALGCLLAGIAVWSRLTQVPAPPSPRTIVAVKIDRSQPVAAVTRKRSKFRPRRAELPIPAALTSQERAFVSFVQQAPKEALQVFGPMQPIEIQPLQINKIDVPPLPETTADQN